MTGAVHDGVEVREVAPNDVPALIACIRRCYGETYTEREFYDQDYLRHELGSGRLVSVGAFVEPRVVGHVGTRLPAPGEVVAETVAGIVDPDYRGRGLIPLMGARMVARYPGLGIAATINVATGAHDRTQRPLVAAGGVATGVLLGHVAARTAYRGISHAFGDARIGVVVYVQVFGQLPAFEVYLPDNYAQRVADLYEQLALERHVVARRTTGSTCPLTGSLHHDSQRGISSLRFGTLANEPTRPAVELVAEVTAAGEEIAYADIPISDPHCLELFDLLEYQGFFFGALLPGSARREAIRLQRLIGAPIRPDAVVTASPAGRSLLQWISRQNAQANSARISYP
jgi:hypothetical protein